MGIRLERAAGPLVEHRPGYQAELERRGYTRHTVKHHLVVVSQLDRYLLAAAAGDAIATVNQCSGSMFVCSLSATRTPLE